MRRFALVLALALLVGSCGGSSPSAPSRPLFQKSGIGDDVFDMPTDVTRVKITGQYSGSGSNFVVWVGGQLKVNEILGTDWPSTTYSGTLAVTGGETRIENSSGVAWSFTEVR